MILFRILCPLLFVVAAVAQNATTSTFTSFAVHTTQVRGNGNQLVNSTVSVPTTITTTILPQNTSSTSSVASTTTSSNSSATTTSTSTPTGTPLPVLDTVLDPGFGVLGAILILTGLPSAFLGHKNRWTSFFLTGFYSLALICLALILKFGVLNAINPPSTKLRGLFVLSCGVAGIAGGGVSVLFWSQAKYFIGGLGGFAFGLWLQAFRSGGIIRPIAFRWIMYIACTVVGFILCTIPKLHYQILLISTSIVGATVFMLGVDCFTTAGLKEFYVYNLGFTGLFPKFSGIPFPLSQTMEIELGLIAAVALAGAAVQLRVYVVLKKKLKEIEDEQKRRDQEFDARAAERIAAVDKDLERWEREHGKGADSSVTTPMLGAGEKQDETLATLSYEGRTSSQFTLVGRGRRQSGVSDLMSPNTEDLEAQSSRPQPPGILPALNLGADIEQVIPAHMVTPDLNDPEVREKEELLAEIENIRRSIEILRSTDSHSPTPGGSGSRHPSTASKPLTPADEVTAQLLPVPRSPLASASRPRVQSMDALSSINSADVGNNIARPTSTPLRDDGWDEYVRERKLFTPPYGTSPPLESSPIVPKPRPVSMLSSFPDAVKEALTRRQRRENSFDFNASPRIPEENYELSRVAESEADTPALSTQDNYPAPPRAQRSFGLNLMSPKPTQPNQSVQILPPRKSKRPESPPVEKPAAPVRTKTFEELASRHREKMRDLQAPLSNAEREQAALEEAKSRWERSKAVEKDAVAKRQAEKAAALAKESAKEKEGPSGRKSWRLSKALGGGSGSKDTSAEQPLSADRVTSMASIEALGNRRMSSAMKVQQWQQAQITPSETPAESSSRPSRRDSRGFTSESGGAVPFPTPSQSRPRDQNPRRKSRALAPGPRDPPS
ncbi:hypothetical protein SISNIDRAFT_486029 [Sistotremastrum niveocremeum HHB9708]|uniref:TM7S3/TM198-like domain-containing protein n=1 Tax=Sistotremastrum niveocremeum HHB9708 TaxID=1314777 RepID=A0A164UC38_9AGAM|nr:hypothetical protein SISNIDRAFT_486029 [Sistotremastrum niveocremeum HHB9708]